jgi:hypothetical protein
MQHMAHDVPPVEIVTMGSNGPRIHAMLQPLADAGRFGLHAAGDLPRRWPGARRAGRAGRGGAAVAGRTELWCVPRLRGAWPPFRRAGRLRSGQHQRDSGLGIG